MAADTLAKEALATGAMDEFDEVQYVPNSFVLVDLSEVQQIENEEKLCVTGSTRKSLWKSFGSQITHPQGRSCRVLLANYPSRCESLCQSI